MCRLLSYDGMVFTALAHALGDSYSEADEEVMNGFLHGRTALAPRCPGHVVVWSKALTGALPSQMAIETRSSMALANILGQPPAKALLPCTCSTPQPLTRNIPHPPAAHPEHPSFPTSKDKACPSALLFLGFLARCFPRSLPELMFLVPPLSSWRGPVFHTLPGAALPGLPRDADVCKRVLLEDAARMPPRIHGEG